MMAPNGHGVPGSDVCDHWQPAGGSVQLHPAEEHPTFGKWNTSLFPRTLLTSSSRHGRQELFRLNAKTGNEIGEDVETGYGVWRLTFVGDLVPREELFVNPGMIVGSGKTTERTVTKVTGVERRGLLPGLLTECRSCCL